jgi:hypothetical protein
MKSNAVARRIASNHLLSGLNWIKILFVIWLSEPMYKHLIVSILYNQTSVPVSRSGALMLKSISK